MRTSPRPAFSSLSTENGRREFALNASQKHAIANGEGTKQTERNLAYFLDSSIATRGGGVMTTVLGGTPAPELGHPASRQCPQARQPFYMQIHITLIPGTASQKAWKTCLRISALEG